MLFRNDIFLHDGQRHRLLHAAQATDTAWALNLEDGSSWPVVIQHSSIRDLDALPLMPSASENAQKLNSPSPAMLRARDLAIELLGNLPERVPEIFDSTKRGALVAARSVEAGCSRKTIYKHLRKWWAGGQTPAALLGMFHECGRTGGAKTCGRGARSRHGHGTHQLSDEDLGLFKKLIEQHYLKDSRTSISSTYQLLLEQHYTVSDGNSREWVRPHGERPSLRQFEYFLRTAYPLEMRLRKREGDKDFERDHRSVLGTVLADCAGVGHYYEADATIADVYLVAEGNINQIVGKPTIYLIMDRKSRLIVGWYVGLENPSYMCAVQAMLSISQDKREICKRYGVSYDALDWPAHQVFPKEVLGDRGELFNKASTQLASEMDVKVTNVPSKRGDWKPVVECGFKQTRMTLQDGTPGFDPPENAKRRQGKKYEKDACLTLKEFSAIILLAIIKHNRQPMKAYELSVSELGNGVQPIPIDLWRHDIVERAGLLPRYEEETVRMALLPRAEATVSQFGIEFKGCYYSCSEAVARGWFVSGRKVRSKVLVSYDGRLVDTLYVHSPDKRGEVYTCSLTSRSYKYRGYSFGEVVAMEKLRARMSPDIEQGRIQVTADFHGAVGPIIAGAKKRLKTESTKASRTARKADIKEARQAELRTERQSTAPATVVNEKNTAQIISLANRTSRHDAPASGDVRTQPADIGTFKVSTPQAPDKPLTLAERARQARQQMMG